MSSDIRQSLQIQPVDLEAINTALANPKNGLVNQFFDVLEKYGTPDEINSKAEKARQLPNLMQRLQDAGSPYVEDLNWLMAERDRGAFVGLDEYRDDALHKEGISEQFSYDDSGVVMEISACQYFPWLIAQAKHAIANREIMPGRFIRVRNMVESAQDQGDLLAMMAAMQIMGTSYVETLDTIGTDGSNNHLDGPDTLLGYFTGPGLPNDYPLKWLDECLYYYTEYGVRQVLNINQGTMLLGYWLGRVGVDIEFKVSVLEGTDNPWYFMSELMMASLFRGPNGKTPFVGMNPTNSATADTLRGYAEARDTLGMKDDVRIEHHVTNFYKGVVKQPYLARDLVVEVAPEVANMAAKHEGGDPETEETRSHQTNMADYFRTKEELETSGDMAHLQVNYMDKHEGINRTALALTCKGLSFGAAPLLHR